MSVNFAAVHDRKPWRKHRIHQSLHAAIDGGDGAKNLLRQLGRVAGMWQKYGDVRCVFVWEDNAPTGYAFRLASVGSADIDSVELSIDQIHQFGERQTCTSREMAALFAIATLSDLTAPMPVPSPSLLSLSPSVEAGSLWPDDLPGDKTYFDGLSQQVVINRYERSPDARAACIAYYGWVCQVCLVDFGKRYGSLGEGFIHVHHVVPVSSVGHKYRVDPVADLVPVCPNCHAMLHRSEPPLTVKRLRALLHDG